MKSHSAAIFYRMLFVLAAFLAFPHFSWPHVTLRPSQPLRLGGYGDVVMNVPSERPSDTVSVTIEVPEAFLKAGGRLIGVEFPPGWQVVIDKEDKPAEVYSEEMARREQRAQASGSSTGAKAAMSDEENEELNEMRKKWIKRVTFKEGSIPPDGFKQFFLSFQLPKNAGTFRFPAVQHYADGTDVGWTELVEGAQHPAPSIVLESRPPQQSNTGMASLVLSGLAFAIAVALALDRFRGKRPNVAGVVSRRTEAV